MEIPPKNNRETKDTNSRSSIPKATRKRGVAVRYVLPIAFVVFGVILLVVTGVRFASVTSGTPTVQEQPISDVLNMADHHQIKSVAINNNDVNATGINGQQYHAVKEEGQSVVEIFRHDGASVNI